MVGLRVTCTKRASGNSSKTNAHGRPRERSFIAQNGASLGKSAQRAARTAATARCRRSGSGTVISRFGAQKLWNSSWYIASSRRFSITLCTCPCCRSASLSHVLPERTGPMMRRGAVMLLAVGMNQGSPRGGPTRREHIVPSMLPVKRRARPARPRGRKCPSLIRRGGGLAVGLVTCPPLATTSGQRCGAPARRDGTSSSSLPSPHWLPRRAGDGGTTSSAS